MPSGRQVLYIKGERNVEVTRPEVTLDDLVSMECTDKMALARIRTITVIKFRRSQHQRCVVSILRIIARIHGIYPEMDIRNLGETDMIVTYENQKTPAPVWHILKTFFVAAVTFFGAAFSIMAFNNDVDVTKLFGQIYEWVTGQEAEGITVLEITYSIGVTAGILIFFNHFGKKRFTVDPTPLEIQMRLYENDIQKTVIENSGRKGDELDVDTADPAGSSRS